MGTPLKFKNYIENVSKSVEDNPIKKLPKKYQRALDKYLTTKPKDVTLPKPPWEKGPQEKIVKQKYESIEPAKHTMVDPNQLRGRPPKKDPNPESPYGIKHPLHPANLKKKKEKKYPPHLQGDSIGKARAAFKHTKEEYSLDKILELIGLDEYTAQTISQKKKSRIRMKVGKTKHAVQRGAKRQKRKMADIKRLGNRGKKTFWRKLFDKLARGKKKKDMSDSQVVSIQKKMAAPRWEKLKNKFKHILTKDARKRELARKRGKR